MSEQPLKDLISQDGYNQLLQLFDDVRELKAREIPISSSSSSLEFYYESATATPPANASFRFDNANISLATSVYIDDNVRNGLDVRLILQMFANADIGIFTESGNSDNAILFVINARINPAGYIQYTLTSITVVGNHTDGTLYNLDLYTA